MQPVSRDFASPHPKTGDAPRSATRREVLRVAAAAPVAAALLPGCGGATAPAGTPTLAALEQANALSARPTPPERLPALLPAARMNHAFFRAIRDLDLDDRIEPAVRFSAAPPPAAESEEG